MAKRGSKKKTTASTRALPLLRRSAGETGTAESKEETGAASPIKNAIKNAAAGEMAEEEKLAGAASPLLRLRSARGETGTAIKNAAAAGEMGEEETAAMGITRTRGDQETPRKKKGRSWKESKAMDDGAAALRRKAREITKEEEDDERLRGEMVSRVRARIRKQQPDETNDEEIQAHETYLLHDAGRGAGDTSDHPAAIARPQDVTTFHIVGVVDTDGARVRLLFRDSDLYFVAFKTGSCWFRFNDEHIPTFLTPTVPIAYTSGYMNIAQVRVGYHCLYDIFNVISRYTPESAQEKTNERQRILQCAALMLSESQRFGHVQLLAIRSGGHRVRLPPPLQAEDETNKQKMMIKKKNTHHPAVPSSSDNVEDLPTVSAPPVTPMVVTQQKNHKKTQAEEVDEKKNQENPNTDATIGAPSGGENHQNRSLISCDGINLYESDLDSLRGPHWVTDAILGYALAKFSRAYSDDGLLLVQPTNAALLNNKHYVAAEADHLLLASRRLVLIPVNDNLDFNQAGDGKHWSLLVIHKTSNDGVIQFIHHDSVRSGDNSYNLHAAQKLANVLRGVLPTAGDVINAETPQQTNGNDCAIHVLAAVQVICRWWRANANKSGPADWIRKLDKRISEGNITQMRASLLQDIERDCQKKKSKDQ
ncbi:hypothetical protein OsJ_34902 [Oryza sativa Japonica Group]|uniref:Ubiquitin-like protease family profile domain-containing protein n=2 Tax=Oryza sativa subsp. japonica TaxID=39947 RepID=A3CE39_ORYSJ|nr:hypothetical protein OsJ_34902 [Oryza sativa Japonica Group]